MIKKTVAKVTTVQQYFETVPAIALKPLAEMRRIVLSAAPGAVEVISYAMPAIKKNKVLVYYAAFKQHIGLYPTSSGVQAFEQDLDGYVYSKGAIQFPLDKPLPQGLIKKIVRYRLLEDKQKAAAKR